MFNFLNFSNGASSGLFLFWGLHMISVFVFGIGTAFLLFWAFKHLSEDTLWKWGWILAVVGAVLCLLTLPAWPALNMFGSAAYGSTWFGMMR